jgi:hypothetical protein
VYNNIPNLYPSDDSKATAAAQFDGVVIMTASSGFRTTTPGGFDILAAFSITIR